MTTNPVHDNHSAHPHHTLRTPASRTWGVGQGRRTPEDDPVCNDEITKRVLERVREEQRELQDSRRILCPGPTCLCCSGRTFAPDASKSEKGPDPAIRRETQQEHPAAPSEEWGE